MTVEEGLEEFKPLIGLKIVGARWLTERESEMTDWRKDTPVLIMENGDQLIAASDWEGNGGGAIFIEPPGEITFGWF